MPGPLGPVKNGRVWDPLVRLFHWSLAVAFATAWFERSEARIHETAGKVVLALIIFRAGWGLIGPASARFETFIKGPRLTLLYVWSILRGRPDHYLGHNPAGAAMIAALLMCLTTTTVSGILLTSTALWGGEWIEWIHYTAANLCLLLVAGHLLGVITACVQHRENLPWSMVTGRKRMPRATPAYLGRSRFSAFRLVAAGVVVLLSAEIWLAADAALNASYWRMEDILQTAFADRGCTVSRVGGPRIEVYPEVRLVYEIAAQERGEPVQVIVSGRDAGLRKPVLDFASALPDCSASVILQQAIPARQVPDLKISAKADLLQQSAMTKSNEVAASLDSPTAQVTLAKSDGALSVPAP
jgi:cytochrome b